MHMAAPSVSVSIVSENQANQLLMSNSNTPKRKEDFNSGDILNGTGTMEYHNATKHVSCLFTFLKYFFSLREKMYTPDIPRVFIIGFC